MLLSKIFNVNIALLIGSITNYTIIYEINLENPKIQ